MKEINKIADKCKTIKEFRNKHSSVYSAARRRGLLKKISKRLNHSKKVDGYWTAKRLKKEARKYKTKTEFINNSKSAYTIAHQKGLIPEICSHMIKPRPYNEKWTKEKVLKEAKKYKTPSEFEQKNGSAYAASRRLGIHKQSTAHMVRKIKKKSEWTKKAVMLECVKYKNISTFKDKKRTAYEAAKDGGYLDEIKKMYRKSK